ncbi:MAG: UDP-N-acetylglucosamine 2-epimerase [Candidatus Handelsmanbacteria bacterium RIFCSPLOWO2_12_FULL_64_10]|uniref:UDP-N-acetylglucosamine 2-epimerase n=1 Tax=Handelsmanbacteria sp. (strain RIFCSPLOWO2_12_FULL_64_10) TaxID=1817868 RepID=A0A1F6CY75_HANXR|nr:MAG: UDP-N-acetylglucosamine 2-epimerase [Candidatus Handelsmanbacteria bacterium RIFCSPLOWO2_12_FULL_64_10]
MRSITLVAGARPNFPKIAPILRALRRHPDAFSPCLVHTDQHYDWQMSAVFFRDLGLPEPDRHLGVGSGSQAVQTAKVLTAFEEALLERRSDLVLVVGDATSTLACALCAAKLNIPVAHVEAGLRSRDRAMPEEINRIVTDAISDLLFTTSAEADANLLREGFPPDKVHRVGNVMIDSLFHALETANRSPILSTLGVQPKGYALVTFHRVSNVDHPETLRGILSALRDIQRRIPLVFPIHPRTRKNLTAFGLQDQVSAMSNAILTEPVGYFDAIKLQKEARLVITDSGGLQEETTALGVPCLTVRENTERPETISVGTNTLVGTSPEKIVRETTRILEGSYKKGRIPDLWDGRAAERIVEILKNR